MIEVIIGAMASLLIAAMYHRRASRDLNELIAGLQKKNEVLGTLIADLEGWHELHHDDLKTIRRHAVAGTPDDPEFPYK